MSLRLSIVLLLASWVVSGESAKAQYNYNRGYRRGYGGYGYGGYGFGGFGYGGAGSTAIGSMLAGGGAYMAGAGQFMAGAGQYNSLSSQAAINYQQAYSMGLDNRLKYEQTYFAMRRENAAERAAMAAERPHATPDQIVEFNRSRTPGRLSPGEWDPSHDIFAWPQSLAGADFADDREQIASLFAVRDADPHSAGLGSENYREIKRHVNAMNDHLHAKIKELSPDEYIAASKFLKSLEYEARFAPSTAMASSKSNKRAD
jgi:hypothetical protein